MTVCVYMCVRYYILSLAKRAGYSNLYFSRVVVYRNYQGISKMVWIQHVTICVKLKSGLDRSDGLTTRLADTIILKVTPLTYMPLVNQ